MTISASAYQIWKVLVERLESCMQTDGRINPFYMLVDDTFTMFYELFNFSTVLRTLEVRMDSKFDISRTIHRPKGIARQLWISTSPGVTGDLNHDDHYPYC